MRLLHPSSSRATGNRATLHNKAIHLKVTADMAHRRKGNMDTLLLSKVITVADTSNHRKRAMVEWA